MLVYLCFGVGCPLPGITASASGYHGARFRISRLLLPDITASASGYHEIALLFSAVLLFLLIDWLSA